MRHTALLSIAFLLFVVPTAHAQSCTGTKPGYTCVSGTWVENCSDGSLPGPSGCTADEIVVTAAKPAGSSGPAFADVVKSIEAFVDTAIIPLLYILAFLFFVWGVFIYFFTGGEENREKGRGFILWSLVGMVVIFGVWGIVRLLLTLIPGT